MKFILSLLCGLTKPALGPPLVEKNQNEKWHSQAAKSRLNHDDLDECPYTPSTTTIFSNSKIRRSSSKYGQRQKQQQSIAESNSDRGGKNRNPRNTAISSSAAKVSTVNNSIELPIDSEGDETCGHGVNAQLEWHSRCSTLPLTNALGTIVTNATDILDRSDESPWKVFGQRSKLGFGYFPAKTVGLINKRVGMQRSASQRTVKKVHVPLVPDIPGMSQNGSTSPVPPPPSLTNHENRPYAPCSIPASINGNYNNAPLSSSSSNAGSNCGTLSRRTGAAYSTYGSLGSTTHSSFLVSNNQQFIENYSSPSSGCKGSLITNGVAQQHSRPVPPHPHNSATNGNAALHHIVASPIRHRNSTGSNSSQTSSGFESMKSATGQPYVNVTVHQLRGDSPPSRNSVHSSGSSSLGSLERLDESGYGNAVHINMAEMILNGVPDQEILSTWLRSLHYEEYLPLFVNAGYDLPTIARMTPEDLTAIGITKPGHRKRLTTEIHKLNLVDQWPQRKPASVREWLCLLKLPEYVPLFESQGFTNVGQLAQLTWEDYEDFGVKKLGHLKKLILASKKLKDYRHQHFQQQQQSNRMGSTDSNGHEANGVGSTELLLINVPPASTGLSSVNQHQRTMAEVRPYSHIPPAEMTTFHQQASPRQGNESMLYRPDLISIAASNRQCSPTHRLYGQQMDQHQNYFQNQNFVVTTEAVVHDRPKVSVKPLLSITTTTSTLKRGSRDGLEKMTEEFKNGNSPLIQSPRNRQCSQPLINMNNCYANVTLSGSSSDVTSFDYRCGTRPTSAIFLNNDVMCRSTPPPGDTTNQQQPPQKPPIGPLARPGAVFQLSANPLPKLMQIADENSSFDELSPAPSMDEFPPPPSPILCVESIKNLRNVREINLPSAADEEFDGADLDLTKNGSASSAGTLIKRRFPADEDNRQNITSTTSIESCSSTETLPFANENVGTIRQKNGNGQADANGNAGTLTRRPHVSGVFANGQQSCAGAAGTTASTPNANKSGDVLNDIGFMLQDLTDQLDALLKEPKQDQQQQPAS